MPVARFHSVEEMDASRSDLWCDKPDAAYFKRLGELWDLSSHINPRKWPRGVFKFRSIEEAQAARERLLSEHIRGLWRNRVKGGKLRIVQKGSDRTSV